MVQNRAATLSGFAARAAILAGLWLLIVQGRTDAWLIGLPAVVLATLSSVHLDTRPLPGFSLAGLYDFVTLFLRESIRGGLDVAGRTLQPRLQIEPGFRRYRLQIQHPSARVLLVNSIGLLPGTLAAELQGDYAELHLLDTRDDPDASLLRLEQAVAKLFGLTLEADDV